MADYIWTPKAPAEAPKEEVPASPVPAPAPASSYIWTPSAGAPAVPSPAAPPQQEEPGWFEPGSKSEAAVRGFSQAATLGFGDEIQAGVRALMGQGSYSQLRDEQRAANVAASEANPGSYMAGQAGAILPTLAAGAPRAAVAAVQAPGTAATLGTSARIIGQKAAQGAATGAAYGGASGLGQAEGDFGDQMVSTVKGAGTGAAFGGILGTLSGAVAEGGRAATSSAIKATEQANPAMKSIDAIKETTGKQGILSGVAQKAGELVDEAKKLPGFAKIAAVLEPVTSSTVAASRAAQVMGQQLAKNVAIAYNKNTPISGAARAMIERGAPFAAVNAVLQEQDPVYRQAQLGAREED